MLLGLSKAHQALAQYASLPLLSSSAPPARVLQPSSTTTNRRCQQPAPATVNATSSQRCPLIPLAASAAGSHQVLGQDARCQQPVNHHFIVALLFYLVSNLVQDHEPVCHPVWLLLYNLFVPNSQHSALADLSVRTQCS
jgi:hypothetical protein